MSLTHRSETGHPSAGPASAGAQVGTGIGAGGKRRSGHKREEAVTISDADLIRLAPRPLAFMFRYVLHHKVQHLLILASVVVAVAAVVGSSYAVHYLVDTLTGYHGGSMRTVWGAVGLLGALIAVDNLAWRVGGWVAARAFVEVTGDLRRDLFRHLTGHAPSYFADRMPGTLAGRITATSNAMFTLENLATWNVLPPVLNVALSILLLLTVSPLMAVVLIALAAAISLLMFRLAASGRPLHHRYASDAARVDGELLDIINNMPLVRAFGATRRERVRFSQRMEGEMSARSRSLRYLERLRLIHAVLTAILTAGLLIWAVMLWHQHAASIGDVVMVVTLGFMILHGTRDLAVALVETIQHVARLAEALSTLLLPHDMPDAADAGGFHGQARGEIVFEHVTYSYPGGGPVLDDFNLRVDAGTRIGMVGRSGSGKTTVLALLQRMRYIQGGRIMIDGKDLLSLTEEALRAVISVVPQDVSLFHRSVLENIRYGKPEATDEEVHAAAEASGCREFIEDMPEGFRTEVGDRGVKLSGGQRQRLAIARAFLRNAPILLLDEATSALDSESEQKVQEALDRLMVGRTVVAVAHRLSTLRDFDRIVVMQSGRVLQDGAPSVLERSEGAYRDLLSRQAMSLEDVL
ncbi:ABC transporter ATP-binding protein [Lichenicola cladoniae]|uniref:ABC transporter ATP-binding protein n=1 Tax=Lichenicola cladoniae TaxID=1484109 RepID=A0A6M8HNG8_9PROT|nr:ABC transporter ATP-binding protein [Acetobacteraceae bacterium]QKE89944.1 ABC transporter ATP-binding protein [Lichenicola cladoniae]